jgi:signal transduction histidine kinase
MVTVSATDGALELDISDDGRRAPSDDGAGHGLRGMRERAAQCGGSLEAGPDPRGGWRVHVRLPVARWTS